MAEVFDIKSGQVIEDKSDDCRCSEAEGVMLLTKHMNDLLKKGDDFDVRFRVQDRELAAHRNILKARCPVFCTMLTHDTQEKKSGIICIEDCDADAFEIFLVYLYTGKAKGLTFKKDLDLYYIANKYDLSELKEMCVAHLKRDLSKTTVCDAFLFSTTHDDSELLEAAKNFFVQNVEEILVTAEWQNFMAKHPAEANKLYIEHVNVSKKNCAKAQTLQRTILYSSSVPVHSSAQVYNGSHLKPITSQPQIITTQAPGPMFSQARQLFAGSFTPLPQWISSATPGNFQSSTVLTQNPIILSRTQSGTLFQSQPQTPMHLPVAAATAPLPATTTYAATTSVAPQKQEQVRNIVNAGTMMTATGQVIGTTTQKANFPQQMIATPGKSTISIHSQSGFANSNPNQIVIGPVGVLPNQQSIFNHKALTDNQKGKTAYVRPGTRTVDVATQAVVSNAVTVNSYTPATWKQVRPGTYTVATQTVVSNAVTINSNTPAMWQQIRPKGKIVVTPYPNATVPQASVPQMATTQTQTNQSVAQTQPQLQPQTPTSTQLLQPKSSDAANQTLPNQVKTVPPSDVLKSLTTQSKSVGVEAKQLSPQMPVKSQAMVAPSTKAMSTTISSTIGISIATVTASPVTTTISTTPIVSASVVQTTASVAPVMTSTETSTSPPPSNLDSVEIPAEDITDSVSVPVTDGFVIQEGPEPFPVFVQDSKQ